MKTGQELIKMNIEKQGLVFFEIQNAKGSTVAAQLDAITPAAAMAELDEICESLPAGRYSCLLSKKGDKEGARIIKGAGGKGYFELPLIINQGANGHIDINSHNANAGHLPISELRQLLEKIKELEKQILLLEIDNKQLKHEQENTGINGVLNNPNVQNALAIVLTNYLSKNPAAGAATIAP